MDDADGLQLFRPSLRIGVKATIVRNVSAELLGRRIRSRDHQRIFPWAYRQANIFVHHW